MNSTAPTAAEITVRQTLDLLDGEFSDVAIGVSGGQYVFWLGAGISRGSVPDLDGVVRRVLEFLQVRLDPGDDGCAHRRAVSEALDLCELSDDDRAEVDISQPVSSWSRVDLIVERLINRYSELLDIRVAGKARDYLLWDAVDLRSSFPPDALPGCEHLCIGVLALEGVLPSAVSANWDGLIESAVAELTDDPEAVLRVLVLAKDFRKPDRRTSLYKFHGCAILAARDATNYRGAIVAAQSQITDWPHEDSTEVMRNAMKLLASTKPSLMIGLSAQDSNIQGLFAAAKSQMGWNWPVSPPAHVFAEDELGQKHRSLLKVVYGAEFEDHGDDIQQSALLRAYAQQTLTALVLYVLTAKFRRLVELAIAPKLGDADRDGLADGLETLRNCVASFADSDRVAFIRTLIETEARALLLFQEGLELAAPVRYRPIGAYPIDQLGADPELATGGFRELAAAVGLLGRGLADSSWEIGLGQLSTGSEGAVTIKASGGVESAVFFVANGKAAVQLETACGVRPDSGDVVMIHSTEPVDPSVRSPHARFGRTGHGGVRNVDMSDLLSTSQNLGDLEKRFRQAAAL